MNRVKMLVMIALLTPLLVACSNAPADEVVEDLIEAQYDKANSLMDDAVAQAGDTEMAKAMGDMLSGMMPTLESVENVNCDSIEGDNTYMCTADVTQTIAGKRRTDKGNFKVYQINDEWVLGS